MFGYKKKNNNKKKTRSNLHTTMMNFTPFMADTRYLEHLHKGEGMLMLRKNMIEGNKRANYQNKWTDYKVKYIGQEWHTQPESI